MIMYKLLPNSLLTGEPAQTIKRIADSSYIPMDEANTDYQAYLKWVAEGNTPEPAETTE
jgi:hypothetical protein